jgi:hypothetical protein
MMRALEELRISGWRSYPVKVQNDQPTNEPLALLAVTGRAGPIYGAGGESQPGMNLIGQYLDPEEWDGSGHLSASQSTLDPFGRPSR